MLVLLLTPAVCLQFRGSNQIADLLPSLYTASYALHSFGTIMYSSGHLRLHVNLGPRELYRVPYIGLSPESSLSNRTGVRL